MKQIGKTIKRDVDLLDSPRDGETIATLRIHAEFDVIGRESWLRVRLHNGEVGFILADNVEVTDRSPGDKPATIHIREYTPLQDRKDVFIGEPIRCDLEFEPKLQEIENLANKHEVQLLIVSSLREPYQPVSSQVVGQAKTSNHFIGHAIDFNIKLEDKFYRSEDLFKLVPERPKEALKPDSGLPEKICQFIDAIRNSDGLRWGGDFRNADPTHMDDGFNYLDEAAYVAKVAAYWGAGVIEREG